jgi:hypothetical protein
VEEAAVCLQRHVPNGLKTYYKHLSPKDVTTSQKPNSGTKPFIHGPCGELH